MWTHLRSRGLGGYKFVRQEPVGPYVVDFLCREQRLVLEIDGGQHATDPKDALRVDWLRQHNYRLMRFWNNEVRQNIEGVLETILAKLDEAGPHHPALALGEHRPLPASGER
jgi:very-short-patch-repair endonuclease